MPEMVSGFFFATDLRAITVNAILAFLMPQCHYNADNGNRVLILISLLIYHRTSNVRLSCN